VNEREKRSSARFGSRCCEDHSDVNGAEPGNFRWLRTKSETGREKCTLHPLCRERSEDRRGWNVEHLAVFSGSVIAGARMAGLVNFRVGTGPAKKGAPTVHSNSGIPTIAGGVSVAKKQ